MSDNAKHREAWEALKASADFQEMETHEAQVLRDLAVSQALKEIPGPWEEKTVMVDGEEFPIAVRWVPDDDDDGLICGGFSID